MYKDNSGAGNWYSGLPSTTSSAPAKLLTKPSSRISGRGRDLWLAGVGLQDRTTNCSSRQLIAVDGKFGIGFILSGKNSFRLLLLLKVQAIPLLFLP